MSPAPVPGDGPIDGAVPVTGAVPVDGAVSGDGEDLLESGDPDVPAPGETAASAGGLAGVVPGAAGPARGAGVGVRRRLVAVWRTVTPRGRAALAVLVGAALLGAWTGWREWLGLAAGLALVLIVAVATALGRSPVAIDLNLQRSRFVVGEPAAARIGVRNTSSRRMLPLRLELDVDGLPAQVRVPSLPGGASHPVSIPLPTHRRAVVELGPARAVRGDVFGLIRRVVQWPVAEQVFVHPLTVRLADPLPGFTRNLEGEESAIRTASDLSFHTLREYVPGDDRRFIHWKSTARSGTLQVREFLQTHRSFVSVVLAGNPQDYRPDRVGVGPAAGTSPASPVTTSEEFELAVSCAASVVAELVRRRRDVVVDAAGAQVRAATAEGVLDRFCAVGLRPGSPDLLAMTRQAARRHPRTSLVVLVFGSTIEPARLRAAARLCPSGATVLAIRARVPESPHPAVLGRLAGGAVVTVEDVAQLPLALQGVGRS